MIAIDTNVLVRVLVDDPTAPQQCEQARILLKAQGSVWVSQPVLIETVWVLESAYGLDKAQLLDVLERILRHPGVCLESSELLDSALSLYSASHTDFADCLILVKAQTQHLILYTFDRKLARLHGAQRVANL
ncbi:type II toxin-antitoxin system VapC family toxin [Candidatus Contendibacter odensensis]|uniref:PIN domain-containing protein n=1 Tax=Candidatus Contendobacter odensis Run_B_J11 TaxID=1400861 RepID=A0A7U7GEY3_9GAMM|nr:type II toxin-antitoxin system VapC family toxin [Candidatus Contendobacter odensis]CDH46874.1 conserved hypothetical protein [Candidatus Contendobacter odensis Run_B_J11]